MPWLSLTVEAEAKDAEALSDQLLELGAVSVDLLDADAVERAARALRSHFG